jgi:hypothetical protein
MTARGVYTVTAIDILAGAARIPTGLNTPRFLKVEVRTSAGLKKEAITDLITIDGNDILITVAGGTHVVATDTVTWFAWE